MQMSAIFTAPCGSKYSCPLGSLSPAQFGEPQVEVLVSWYLGKHFQKTSPARHYWPHLPLKEATLVNTVDPRLSRTLRLRRPIPRLNNQRAARQAVTPLGFAVPTRQPGLCSAALSTGHFFLRSCQSPHVFCLGFVFWPLWAHNQHIHFIISFKLKSRKCIFRLHDNLFCHHYFSCSVWMIIMWYRLSFSNAVKILIRPAHVCVCVCYQTDGWFVEFTDPLSHLSDSDVKFQSAFCSRNTI